MGEHTKNPRPAPPPASRILPLRVVVTRAFWSLCRMKERKAIPAPARNKALQQHEEDEASVQWLVPGNLRVYFWLKRSFDALWRKQRLGVETWAQVQLQMFCFPIEKTLPLLLVACTVGEYSQLYHTDHCVGFVTWAFSLFCDVACYVHVPETKSRCGFGLWMGGGAKLLIFTPQRTE